ncbi:hypothetical protein JXB12_13585 [candidate division KSB1 bacterium]|nr:hypothetical protein [candidate division KSB1 bacterium]
MKHTFLCRRPHQVLLFLLIVFSIPHLLLSDIGSIEGIHYQFHRTDSCYSFRGSFSIDGDYECLIRILYDFAHLKNIITSADSIVLIRQGEDWYDVRYTFKKFFITNASIYRKSLKSEEHKVTFTMISSQQNTNLIPNVSASSGYYRITQDSTGYVIEYYQEFIMSTRFLRGFYVRTAKKESLRFMLNLREYLERMCVVEMRNGCPSIYDEEVPNTQSEDCFSHFAGSQ